MAKTIHTIGLIKMGGSLKAVGFGDGFEFKICGFIF